jgi:hypothetical protein
MKTTGSSLRSVYVSVTQTDIKQIKIAKEEEA